VDLSKLKANEVKHKPDDMGEFSLQMKQLKVPIKFRLLTGADESIINKYAQQDFKKVDLRFQNHLPTNIFFTSWK